MKCWLLFNRDYHAAYDSYNDLNLLLIGQLLCIRVLPHRHSAWWRHQMETFSALLALCAGNSPVTGEFSAKARNAELWCFLWSAPWINGWANNREAGDLRRHLVIYDLTVMGCDNGVMPWRREAASHYRNQCWLLISEVLQHLVERSFTAIKHFKNNCRLSQRPAS